jgi:CPA2 family monovalent cation:H+ antiporter-2
MTDIDLIQDFAILLLAAGLAGLLCKRLGLSVIVGYLAAGIIIGPHTPPFSLIVDEARIMALSQVGLVFLIFSIGLGLSVSKFARMGAGTLVATGLGAFFVLNLTELLGFAIGWTPLQAMFVAAMLMVSSSAVIAKIVAEQGLSHERSSQLALAVTVLEDVVAVAMLTILGAQAQTGADDTGLGGLLGALTAFIVLLVGAGLLLVPRLLRRLEARADPEMQTVVVAGVLFVLALTAAKAGFSIALGAFLFGAVVAEIPQKLGIEKSFAGLRDMFSSVFFVSIGMLIDLRLLGEVWPTILGLAAFALVGRPLACGVALILVGTDPREARRASLLLTPLGEFSFIIAQLGISTAILSPSYYPIAVGASILTVFATPILNRRRDAILHAAERLEPRWLQQTLAAYHGWIHHLQSRPARRPVWSILRKRLTQIAVEVALVSGLIVYSGRLLDAVSGSTLAAGLDHQLLAYGYWAIVGVLVLVPLVAIWRNGAAVAMIVGESVEGGPVPRTLVERGLKALLAVGLGYWIYVVLPKDSLTRWGWLIIAVAGAIVVTVFSRRLIFWHSEWQSSVNEVLADRSGDVGEVRAQARAALGESLEEWNLALGDCLVPDDAGYAGRRLAELSIPARFGCSIIEIDRNGHALTNLGPEAALFPGDRVLLLGEAPQIAAARDFLTQGERSSDQAEAGAAVLDTIRVTGPKVGRTLAELKLATETGVRVAGIQRDGRRILNPTGGERLHEGDDLLLLGTLAKIRAFRQWFACA